jgi:mannitol-1-phosphate 5-dehydrogenase
MGEAGKAPAGRGFAAGKSGTAVVIGAGATGRGHVGQLAVESGYSLVLVDKDRGLCDALAASGSYEVRLVSAHTRTVTIEGFRIFHTSERDSLYPAFREAKVVFTAVCPGNIPDAAAFTRDLVVRWLREDGAKGCKNILCCENMDRSSTVFKEHLLEGFPAELKTALDERVGFADTMVARVVAKPADPLRLLGEEYSEWTADRKALRGDELPAVRTLDLVDDQTRYLRRKLYIHNTGHATFGYLGFLRGHTYIHQAAQDPRIMEVCRKAIEESGWAIQKEYGFPVEVIAKYRDALTEKCVSPELPDEILRVVREPARKLGKDERFFGPLRLMLAHGRKPEHLLYGICGALLSRIPADAQSLDIERQMREKGPACLSGIAGFAVPDDVVARVRELLPVVRERFEARP